jgi:ABC-type arginine transport system permease subunit
MCLLLLLQSMDSGVSQQWRQHTVDTLALPGSAQWLQLLQGYAPVAVISVQTVDNTLRNRYKSTSELHNNAIMYSVIYIAYWLHATAL